MLQVQQYSKPEDIDNWFLSEGGVLIISFKQVQLLAPINAAKKEALKQDAPALKKQKARSSPLSLFGKDSVQMACYICCKKQLLFLHQIQKIQPTRGAAMTKQLLAFVCSMIWELA